MDDAEGESDISMGDIEDGGDVRGCLEGEVVQRVGMTLFHTSSVVGSFVH